MMRRFILAVICVLVMIPMASPIAATHEGYEDTECGSNGHSHNSVTHSCWATLYYNSTTFWGYGYTQASESIAKIEIWNQGWEQCLGIMPTVKWATGWQSDTDDDLISGGGSADMVDACWPSSFIASNSYHEWSSSPHGHQSTKSYHHPNAYTGD